jgi:hypothetical protein
MTKIIQCEIEEDMTKYIEPFMYSPDRTSVWTSLPIRATCPECGLYQFVSRSDCDLNGGFVCQGCQSSIKCKVIPDGGTSFHITPIEVRVIHYN